MPILTGLAPDPRQPDHWLVEVDRGRFASLPAEAVGPFELRVGQPLDGRTLNRLSRLADAEAAFRAGLRALARRAYAVGDLRRKLVQRQHPVAAVDDAVQRLRARGLLDDARFASQFAASKFARGRGPSRVLRDLQVQGVERRLAEQAVRETLERDGLDPVATARQAARQRAALLADLPVVVRRRRLAAFLLRRGFAGPHLAGIVRDATGA